MIPVGTFETIEVPEGQAPQLTKSAQATQEQAQDVLDAADEGSRYRRRRIRPRLRPFQPDFLSPKP
jgi:hypothetical protein